MPCCVTDVCLCNIIHKSARGDSFVSVLQDSILKSTLHSLFSICAGIENRKSSQESRLTMDCQLTVQARIKQTKKYKS